MPSKHTAHVARRGVSDREFELLLRRTPEYSRLSQSRLAKKVQPIRKAPAA